MHRVIGRRHTAVGHLADFQGANDEPALGSIQRVLSSCVNPAYACLKRVCNILVLNLGV
jgi:hypothetical protein